MKLTKLTVLLLAVIILNSCDKSDTEYESGYSRQLPVTASQAVPSLPSPGTATLDVSYTPGAKAMAYTVTWNNLTDSVIAIRINGPSPRGYNAPNLTFTGANPTSPATTPHNVIQEVVASATKALFGKSGSYSNTLLVDGIKVKESDLLRGYYYLTIHTKTILPPPTPAPSNLAYRWFGELRGQIEFN